MIILIIALNVLTIIPSFNSYANDYNDDSNKFINVK